MECTRRIELLTVLVCAILSSVYAHKYDKSWASRMFSQPGVILVTEDGGRAGMPDEIIQYSPVIYGHIPPKVDISWELLLPAQYSRDTLHSTTLLMLDLLASSRSSVKRQVEIRHKMIKQLTQEGADALEIFHLLQYLKIAALYDVCLSSLFHVYADDTCLFNKLSSPFMKSQLKENKEILLSINPFLMMCLQSHELLPVHKKISACAWSTDGTYLVTGCLDGELILWVHDEHGWRIIQTLRDPESVAIETIAWDPHTQQFAVGNATGTVSVWYFNVRDKQWKRTVLHRGASREPVKPVIAWHMQGEHLAISIGRSAMIWAYHHAKKHWELQATLPEEEGVISALAWSPDGLLATGSYDDRMVKLWAQNKVSNQWSLIQQLMSDPDAMGVFATLSCSFNREGTRFALSCGNRLVYIWAYEKEHNQWSLLTILRGFRKSITQVAWSNNGEYILLADGHEIKVWADGGKWHPYLTLANDSIGWAVHPQAQYLASISMEGQLILYDYGQALTPEQLFLVLSLESRFQHSVFKKTPGFFHRCPLCLPQGGWGYQAVQQLPQGTRDKIIDRYNIAIE